jgi:cytochrome P450
VSRSSRVVNQFIHRVADIIQQTIVSCWHYAMNHSASNWSDPYTYSPERWLEKDNSQDRLDALQPFHLGPGNCIGRK